MKIPLLDEHENLILQGVYINRRYNIYNVATYLQDEIFYIVKKEGNKWYATSDKGKKYKVDYPKNLPDSAIMPEGSIDSTQLSPVRIDQARDYLRLFRRKQKELTKRLWFLEEIVKE